MIAGIVAGGNSEGTPPTTDYLTAALALSPRNYWRMAATSGGSEPDIGSAGNTGGYSGVRTQGVASLCGDAGDYAVSFPGLGGGYMQAGGTYALNSGGASFGLSFLFNPANVSGLKGMVSMGANLPYVRLSGSTIQVLASQLALLGSFADAAVAGTKSHLLISFGPSSTSYYFNGEASGGHSGGAFTAGTTQIFVGNENLVTDNMDGVIDEVMYFDYAPSAGDAASLYAAVTP